MILDQDVGYPFPMIISPKNPLRRGLIRPAQLVVQSAFDARGACLQPPKLKSAQGLILTIVDERRQCLRFKIDCPVTVLTPGRGRKRVLGRGWLFDISDKGARFVVDQLLEIGARISLEVDFQHPDGEITTIRYPGIVKWVSEGDSYETAVFFLKGETYIRGKGSKGKSKEFPRGRFTKGSRWIN